MYTRLKVLDFVYKPQIYKHSNYQLQHPNNIKGSREQNPCYMTQSLALLAQLFLVQGTVP